jgi:hypothetical protein
MAYSNDFSPRKGEATISPGNLFRTKTVYIPLCVKVSFLD